MVAQVAQQMGLVPQEQQGKAITVEMAQILVTEHQAVAAVLVVMV